MRIIPDQIKKSKRKLCLSLDEKRAQILDRYARFQDCTHKHIIGYAVTDTLKQDEEFHAYRSKLTRPGLSPASTTSTPKSPPTKSMEQGGQKCNS